MIHEQRIAETLGGLLDKYGQYDDFVAEATKALTELLEEAKRGARVEELSLFEAAMNDRKADPDYKYHWTEDDGRGTQDPDSYIEDRLAALKGDKAHE